MYTPRIIAMSFLNFVICYMNHQLVVTFYPEHYCIQVYVNGPLS